MSAAASLSHNFSTEIVIVEARENEDAHSKYHVTTKVPGISSHRPDRVSQIVDMLEKKGHVEALQTANVTYYQISQKGREAYDRWIKEFLNFMRSL